MRIQVINHRDWLNPRTGGVEEVVRQTCTRWAAAGHDVRLLVSSFRGAKERDFVADGVKIMRRGREETFNWTAPLRYRPLFEQADVNVEHLSKVACMLPWYTKRPVVGYYYHFLGSSLVGNVFLPIAHYVRLMEKLAARVYRRCPAIVISQSTVDELATLGVPRENMKVVYCGVNLDLFRPAVPPIKTAHPSIVWVGRVRKTKGVALAVEGFERLLAKLPAARLRDH
jgi:glycosyltransferase involved in cell wall biosynthesis